MSLLNVLGWVDVGFGALFGNLQLFVLGILLFYIDYLNLQINYWKGKYHDKA